ncbi:MAG: hypothetical protein O3C21_04865 [Verrucomicrobia bacterium]|nr:hypothetical protein [Verrucomicrobiota bacterium]
MKSKRFPWKGALGSGIVFTAVFLGAINWFYLRDEPDPPPPAWAIPIVRDREEVAALQHYFDLKSPLTNLQKADRARFANGCLAGTATEIAPDEELAFRAEIAALVAEHTDALTALKRHLDSTPTFTYPESTKYDFSDQPGLLNYDHTDGLLILLRMQMCQEFWSGDPHAAIDPAIESVALARRLLYTEGLLIHHMLGVTAYNVALKTLYSAAWLARDDSTLLQLLIKKTLPLRIDHVPFEHAIVADHFWSKSTAEQTTLEQMRKILPEERNRIFWKVPSLFFKANQTKRLYQETSSWLIDNAATPYYSRSSPPPWEKFWKVTEKGLVRDIHPNAIGHMLALNTANTLEVILDRTQRSEFFLECIQTACALRIFELEHGAYPGDLAELVPDYVDRLPQDPQDRKAVRFRDGILFGIGEDDIEEGTAWRSPFESAADPALAVPGRRPD